MFIFLSPEPGNMLHYMEKKIKAADAVTIADQLTLKQRDYSVLSRSAQCSNKVLKNGRMWQKRGVKERDVIPETRSEKCYVATLENGGRGCETRNVGSL